MFETESEPGEDGDRFSKFEGSKTLIRFMNLELGERREVPELFRVLPGYHLDNPVCSSKIQVLFRLLVILLKIELDKLRLLFMDDPLELEFEDGLNLPKKENMLRKALPNPPSPLLLFLLDSHMILLGVPDVLLNPPSISV